MIFKSGHFKSRLDELKNRSVFELNACFKSLMIFVNLEIMRTKIQMIKATPAINEEQKQEKYKAIINELVNCVIIGTRILTTDFLNKDLKKSNYALIIKQAAKKLKNTYKKIKASLIKTPEVSDRTQEGGLLKGSFFYRRF